MSEELKTFLYTLYLNQSALYRPERGGVRSKQAADLPSLSKAFLPLPLGDRAVGQGLYKNRLQYFLQHPRPMLRGKVSVRQGGLIVSWCISLPFGPIFLVIWISGTFFLSDAKYCDFTHLEPYIFFMPLNILEHNEFFEFFWNEVKLFANNSSFQGFY